MQQVKPYNFYKTKYGDELLIDIVELKDVKKYLSGNPTHSLSYYDITLVTDGKDKFTINDNIYNVKNDDIIFSSPHQIRKWDTIHILNGYALIFEEEFLLSFFNDHDFIQNLSYFGKIQSNHKLTLDKEDSYRISKLMREIKHEINLYKEKDKHILRALLYQVLKLLDRIFIAKNQNEGNIRIKDRYINHFLELVDTGFSVNHSPAYYAGKLCISSNYLNELVKAATGKNSKQIITSKIMQEAKKLLLYTSASVTEIATKLNYESPSYFIRFFKKQTGITPLQYRIDNKP